LEIRTPKDSVDLTFDSSEFGTSLLLVLARCETRHRAFREPTLDSSRMSVRFSFQGPRQLRSVSASAALGSRIILSFATSSTTFFFADSFFSFSLFSGAAGTALRGQLRRISLWSSPSRMRSPFPARRGEEDFQLARICPRASAANRRSSWSRASSPSSDSLKIFLRGFDQIEQSCLGNP